MKLQTASSTISFVKELEEKAAKFYDEVPKKFGKDEDTWVSFAKENRKFAKQIQMAYQNVISDAIEGCFAFDLESDNFDYDTDLPENASYNDAVDKALAIEGKITDLYTVGAEQSGSLLADVPRNFKIVIRKRSGRIEKLKSLK